MDSDHKNSLLIVDDDKSNLMVLSHILKADYTVRLASDGASALRIAEKYQPDLILLDIIMPDMDGYQVIVALQNSNNTARIPVIFITGLTNNVHEKRGLELGAVDYINKPFDDMIVKLRVQHQIQIINQMRTIEFLSMMDQLTGIANRRNFDNRLKAEWGRARRGSQSLSLLLVDVDHFKRYNDTYGHQQGDKALCVVARILTQTLRRVTDFAARWGGEEFVVLLPNAEASGGLAIAELIRETAAAEDIPLDNGDSSKLTVSIGVSAFTPTPSGSITVDEFILRADKALYKAKETGRNKVCLFEE
jgi:diguanylate cyclase (GGDEF)-like protein